MHNRRVVRGATPTIIVLSVSAIVSAVACASSEEVPANPETQQETQEPTAKLPPPTSGSDAAPPPPAPKQCVASCKSDSECANSCPVPATGASCCDVATRTCFTNATNTCPKPPEDDAGTPPAY